MFTKQLTTKYAFDNDCQLARDRLAMLEAWTDPGTLQHLEARGIRAGWHYLEVGAGGGSITEWLCQQVGERGRVLATDINTRFVDQLDHPALDVVRHNIATEERPDKATFDLVHTRAVLGHLPEREEVLRRLVAALKPGGWLVVEEMGFRSAASDTNRPPDSSKHFAKALHAHNQVLTARSVDVHYGNRLLADLRDQDLIDIAAEGRVSALHSGTAGAKAWRLSFEQLRDDMLSARLLTNSEFDELLALFDDAQFTFMSQVIMTGWGRRPVA